MNKKNNNQRNQSLTMKQERFCQYYVDTDGNASESYRMAYDCSKMQSETIWSNASRLANKSKVIARINEIKRERAEKSRVKRETVEKVLMDIITVDPSELFLVDEKTGKVKIKNANQLPKNLRNALKSIKNNRGIISYEFNGKTEAARLLASWNGWDAPKEVNLKTDGNVVGELRIGFDDRE